MQLKDATSVIGRVGLLIPLVLIFLIAADSAYACPGHKSKVAYRTKAINRTVSGMPTTVIAYRAPASYRRCGDNLYDTRGKRYVAVRSRIHSGSGARFVAVRDGEGYKVRQTRYVAVRNVDLDDGPRYVAVRHRYPIHRISGTRYAEIRSGYRSGNGIVRYIDVDVAPRQVVVRRVPTVRYVAVRRAVPTKYVSIDSGSTRAIALRRSLDEVETGSVKHVVLRDDDPDLSDLDAAAFREDSDDDTSMLENESDDAFAFRDEGENDAPMLESESDDVAYAAVPRDTTNYVEFRDATYSQTPVAVSTRPITYAVSDDDDMDDEAILDGGGAKFIAADDVEDARLRPVAVVDTSPEIVSTEAVSYVPIEYVDNDASFIGSDPTYVETENAASSIRYVPIVEDEDIEAETVSYVPVDEVADVETETVSYVPVVEVEDAESVSFVPVDDVEEAETVSYVPVEDVEDLDPETVTFVPVDDTDMETVSYVPVESVSDVDTTDIAACECPMLVSRVEAVPLDVLYTSTPLVEEVGADLIADASNTESIAGQFGYRDGFEDGKDAALEGDLYHPENSGDYQKATEGYEDDFGDKDVYKGAYRDTYLQGYRAGFESVDSTA